MPDNFETVIDTFVIDTEAKILGVTRRSIFDMIEDVQTPTQQGGRMRVDTGFLRISGLASLNSLPAGLGKGRKRAKNEVGVLDEYSGNVGEQVNITLGKMEIGDAFYFGWTANYAVYREAFDGFLETGLQKWQSYVDENVRKFNK
tara:strand:- start:1519 stop:1953 length:435 start_codon:yes stop_codon:yes gene_type:complete